MICEGPEKPLKTHTGCKQIPALIHYDLIASLLMAYISWGIHIVNLTGNENRFLPLLRKLPLFDR